MRDYNQIHQRALAAAKQFQTAEGELLDVLQVVEEHRVHYRLGFASMHEYASLGLNLSDSNASNFITVARKSLEVPQLKTAIKGGKFSVTKARKITPVIHQSNQEHWILLATTLTQRLLEREVAKVRPETAHKDKARPIGNDRVELIFTVTDKVLEKWKRAQDLESQRIRSHADYEMTLTALLDFYLEKKDSLTVNARASVAATRLRRKILRRDNHRCTFTAPDGRRCESRRWLDVHHVTPKAEGGTDDPENLRTLCHAHHRLMHEHSTL